MRRLDGISNSMDMSLSRVDDIWLMRGNLGMGRGVAKPMALGLQQV